MSAAPPPTCAAQHRYKDFPGNYNKIDEGGRTA